MSLRMSSTYCSRALLVVLFLAAAALPASGWQSGEEFHQQLLTLTAKDGVKVEAVLTYPRGGPFTSGPAIVHHHGGPGGNPAQRAPRWMSEGLARRGYTSLAIRSRHSSGYPWRKFGEAVQDIAAAVDFLETLGFKEVVLSGNSLGSIRHTRYVTETQDSRVKALVHLAPTRGLSEWMQAGLGERAYWEMVERATKLVSLGRGDEIVNIRYVMPPPATGGDEFLLAQTAEAWLEWWGPASPYTNLNLLPQIRQPMLLLAGDKDVFVSEQYLGQLKKAAVKSAHVDSIWYTGGVDHGFAPIHDRVVNDVANWLRQVGLAPRPEVRMQLVDFASADGRTLTGSLYVPASGSDPQKPAVLLFHGWTSDIFVSSSRWLPRQLAEQGYVAMAFLNRASGTRNRASHVFDEVLHDIKGAIDFLEKRGHPRVVLAGHSFGSIRISRYMAKTKDQRVQALVHLAPTRDAPAWLKEGMGAGAYDRVVKEAQEAVQRGQGSTHPIHVRMYFPPPAPANSVPFETIQYADSFLSVWGPQASTIHTQQIAEVGVRSLFLAGAKDVYVDQEFLQHLASFAKSGADVVWYGGAEGADHGFTGYESKVTADIVTWLARNRTARAPNR